MQKRNTMTGWRKVGVAVVTMAVLTAGAGALATQAFADPGATATVKASSKAIGKATAKATGKVSAKSSKKPQCSDARDDLKFTPVPKAGKALEAAVGSVAQGTISDVSAERVSATCHSPGGVTARLMFAPADGTPAGQVAVAFLKPGELDYAGGAEAYVSTCDDGDEGDLEDCELSTLPDGTRLRTFAVRMDLEGGTWEFLVAERLVDGYVVAVSSYGPRARDELGTVLGDAVLSTDQIVDVAVQLTPIA